MFSEIEVPSYPIINLLIYLMLVFVYVRPIFLKKGLYYKQPVSDNINFILFFAIATLFCVFAFSSGDFYSYYIEVRKVEVLHRSKHFEDVYVWIINNITNNYLWWRTIVWGGATYLTLIAFRRLGLKGVACYAAITLFYLTTLYFMRGNLGIGILFLGLTFLLAPRRKMGVIDIGIGVVLVAVSYFFHKSMLLSLALLVPAMFNLNKKTLVAALCFFPVAVLVMRAVLIYLGDNGLEGTDEMVSNSAERYAKTEMFEYNVFGILQNIVIYTPFYIIMLYAYRTNLMKRLPQSVRFFFNYWFVWVYIASVCAFQDTGGWFYSRFMSMSNLPLTVFMAYVFQHDANSKFLKTIVISGFLGNLYILAYAFYQMQIK